MTYEMAIRDHFRLDVLVMHASRLQQIDAELAEIERQIRLGDAGAAGRVPGMRRSPQPGCGVLLVVREPADSGRNRRYVMRRRNAAAVSAAAMAALAALAGPASAQDEAQGQAPAPGGQGSTTPTPAPCLDDPCPGHAHAGRRPLRADRPRQPRGRGRQAPAGRARRRAPRSSAARAPAASCARRPSRRTRRSRPARPTRPPTRSATCRPRCWPPPVTGVPNVVIDSLRIPPFLLPIYQAAGVEYGVRWEILAAINEIETDYGRNLSVELRRRARLDAVHARRPGRPTASTPTATGARIPTTRSTRSSPPRATCAPPAPTPICARRSSPTTTPTGTSTTCSRARSRSPALPPTSSAR